VNGSRETRRFDVDCVPDSASQVIMSDNMRRQTEDIIRYYGELNRRIATAGMEGIPKLLEASRQIEHALGEVAPQELDWLLAEIKRLLDQLVLMDSQLQRLRELKAILDGGATPDDAVVRKRASL
jgi:hypothetical protein